jgi:hypothetical protein
MEPSIHSKAAHDQRVMPQDNLAPLRTLSCPISRPDRMPISVNQNNNWRTGRVLEDGDLHRSVVRLFLLKTSLAEHICIENPISGNAELAVCTLLGTILALIFVSDYLHAATSQKSSAPDKSDRPAKGANESSKAKDWLNCATLRYQVP